MNPSQVTPCDLYNYSKVNYPLINLLEITAMIKVLKKSIHFQNICDNNLNWNKNPYLPFHIFLESISILKNYSNSSLCMSKYLEDITKSSKIDEIEKSYLDKRNELEMVKNFVYGKLLNNLLPSQSSGIKFDDKSDFFNRKNISKIDLVINKNNINIMNIECKRISESLSNYITNKNNNPHVDTILIHDDILTHYTNEELQKVHTKLIEKIHEKLSYESNLKQLEVNFKSNSCNIFYLCIEGDSTSVTDTTKLNLLLHDYFNIFINSNLNKSFSLQLYKLCINYIILAFSDRYLILSCNSTNNSCTIEPESPTIRKIQDKYIIPYDILYL